MNSQEIVMYWSDVQVLQLESLRLTIPRPSVLKVFRLQIRGHEDARESLPIWSLTVLLLHGTQPVDLCKHKNGPWLDQQGQEEMLRWKRWEWLPWALHNPAIFRLTAYCALWLKVSHRHHSDVYDNAQSKRKKVLLPIFSTLEEGCHQQGFYITLLRVCGKVLFS